MWGDTGSGMGVASGDYDGDGRFDLFITNWERELNALYRNTTAAGGPITFQYSTFRIGISGLGNGMTGWGTHWIDLDHDTDRDLLIVNGRVPVTNLQSDPELVRYYRNRTWNAAGGQRPSRPVCGVDAAGRSQGSRPAVGARQRAGRFRQRRRPRHRHQPDRRRPGAPWRTTACAAIGSRSAWAASIPARWSRSNSPTGASL
jgi:hypothetical protein